MLHHIIIVGFRALWCCNVPSYCQLDPERNIINLTCLQFSTYQVLYLVGILLKIQMTVWLAVLSGPLVESAAIVDGSSLNLFGKSQTSRKDNSTTFFQLYIEGKSERILI